MFFVLLKITFANQIVDAAFQPVDVAFRGDILKNVFAKSLLLLGRKSLWVAVDFFVQGKHVATHALLLQLGHACVGTTEDFRTGAFKRRAQVIELDSLYKQSVTNLPDVVGDRE